MCGHCVCRSGCTRRKHICISIAVLCAVGRHTRKANCMIIRQRSTMSLCRPRCVHLCAHIICVQVHKVYESHEALLPCSVAGCSFLALKQNGLATHMRKRHGMIVTLPCEQTTTGAHAQTLECRQCYAKCMDEIEVCAHAWHTVHSRVRSCVRTISSNTVHATFVVCVASGAAISPLATRRTWPLCTVRRSPVHRHTKHMTTP